MTTKNATVFPFFSGRDEAGSRNDLNFTHDDLAFCCLGICFTSVSLEGSKFYLHAHIRLTEQKPAVFN